ncbi:hypothetical protein AVEN_108136-1 [Araneus ventricosus]|uniref:DUF4817 domain-containing protein n=1 Tax=Araneus ventricosus TaxID=182803 RepID=A0A4Y2ESG8_ARAVE|nr:hypothetical protein AVEN_108136-1 [Araneus ventricosus]
MGNEPLQCSKSATVDESYASVKMATVQQMAHLWFYKSKSIVTVERCFCLEYRNCQSRSKNFIKRWSLGKTQGCGGLVVRCWLRGRRVPDFKPNSTEDLPCMGPVAH